MLLYSSLTALAGEGGQVQLTPEADVARLKPAGFNFSVIRSIVIGCPVNSLHAYNNALK